MRLTREPAVLVTVVATKGSVPRGAGTLMVVFAQGELGTIGATPCVVNAIADALARNGKYQKSQKLQMPLTPFRLWELLNGA